MTEDPRRSFLKNPLHGILTGVVAAAEEAVLRQAEDPPLRWGVRYFRAVEQRLAWCRAVLEAARDFDVPPPEPNPFAGRDVILPFTGLPHDWGQT